MPEVGDERDEWQEERIREIHANSMTDEDEVVNI